jgi:hypothetical protein
MNVGDYVEIIRSEPYTGTTTLRGIVLEMDRESAFWKSCRIYIFEEYSCAWYYEYEVTVISEADENGDIQDILSCSGE